MPESARFDELGIPVLQGGEDVKADGQWRTLEEIAKRCNASEAGASARLRDFRKQAYGGFTVRRRRVSGTNIYEYQLDLAD
jgi:hypothetical protein